MEERGGLTEQEQAYYSLSSRVYAIAAPLYDTVTRPIRKLRWEVADAVELGANSRVLDVCTGTGAQAFAFAERAGEVVGVDLSAAMLAIAGRKNRFSNVSFRQADAARLPFDDRTFDAACVSFALHEMPSSIRARVIAEMARVTTPGGSVVVVDYGLPRNRAASWLVYRIVKLYEPEYYAEFVRSDLERLLGVSGIEVTAHRRVLFGVARIVTGRAMSTR
jgi:demethylmenaquinone methyltransferase/2-methoxy-6-polyprenyl-1,4-benzoquinol methylase